MSSRRIVQITDRMDWMRQVAADQRFTPAQKVVAMALGVRCNTKSGMVLAYRFNGQRFDCGSVEGFVAATNYFYASSGGEGAEQDVSGVQFFYHEHAAHTGFFVAIDNSPLDGCGAAIFRQQRGMNINGTETGQC